MTHFADVNVEMKGNVLYDSCDSFVPPTHQLRKDISCQWNLDPLVVKLAFVAFLLTMSV